MTEFEKLTYVLFAIATPLFIAFEVWVYRKRKHNRDAQGK